MASTPTKPTAAVTAEEGAIAPQVASLEEGQLSYVMLVYEPERDAPMTGGFRRNGVMRLPMPKTPDEKAQARGQSELELEAVSLAPGSDNIVSLKTLKAMEGNPFFASCLRRKVLSIHHAVIPANGKITHTTADFRDLDIALQLIELSNNEEWLNTCIIKDDREGITQACRDRISEIQSSLNHNGGIEE